MLFTSFVILGNFGPRFWGLGGEGGWGWSEGLCQTERRFYSEKSFFSVFVFLVRGILGLCYPILGS